MQTVLRTIRPGVAVILTLLALTGWIYGQKFSNLRVAKPVNISVTPREAFRSPETPSVKSDGSVPEVSVENGKKTNTSNAVGSEKLPERILLDVPFLAQAPFGVWDPLHEDACEEASLLMLKYYTEGKKVGSLEKADEEIKSLVAFQESRGYGVSVSLEELEKISENHLGFKVRVERDITIEDIKKELAAGHPVIVGAGGKILGNPNFRNGGPLYHMLIIKGYDAAGFITNDPGTRKGENYHYSYEVMRNSLRDWNEAGKSLVNENNYIVAE